MDINYYVSLAISFLSTNRIVALVIGLALLLFIWKKPGAAIRFAIFVAIVAVVFYLISLLGGAMFEGADYSENIHTKSMNQLEQ